jgi:hypothetical protein
VRSGAIRPRRDGRFSATLRAEGGTHRPYAYGIDHPEATQGEGYSPNLVEGNSVLKKSLSARSAVLNQPEARPKHHESSVFSRSVGGRKEREGVFQHAGKFCERRLNGTVFSEVRKSALNARCDTPRESLYWHA